MPLEEMFWQLLRWIRLQVMMIRPRDTDFDKLGVRSDPAQQPGLEAIVEAFRQGYNLTLADDELATLSARMTGAFEPAFCAFAHEGTGMALTLLDWFSDQKRVERYLERCPKQHDTLLMLGVGFALARAPWVRNGVENYAQRFAPGFDGLIMNGYGFHEGCFKTDGDIDTCPLPRLSAEGARCFDHGLGRALWFMCGASPRRIADTFRKIPVARHPDLWAGLGTAVCFAGRAYADAKEYDTVLSRMQELAGETNRGPFGLGIVLASMLQYRSNFYTRWVDRACEKILGMSNPEVGALGDRIWNESVADAALATKPYAVYQRAGDTIISTLATKILRS